MIRFSVSALAAVMGLAVPPCRAASGCRVGATYTAVVRSRRIGTSRRTIGVLASHLIIAAALPAGARAGCIWSDLVTDQAKAAVVRSHVHFVQDGVLAPGCPSADMACQSKAYLRPGDIVLVGPTQGTYTCAGFGNAQRSETIDWLPTASLNVIPNTSQAGWTGHWVAPAQDIAISPGKDGALIIKGEATWGAGAATHTGEIEGTIRPDRGVLAFTMGEDKTLPYDNGDDADCRVRMIRRGPYLLVRDNNKCGGANVSFSGFYRRTH